MLMVINAIRTRRLIAIISSIAIFFLLPIIQSITTPLAFEIWFMDIVNKPLNSALYIIFSILFGMYVSLYVYSKRNVCIECNSMNANKTGLIGSALGFLIGVCPACFSFIAFLLPLGSSIFLSLYSPLFTLIAIAVIAYSIYRFGGFKRV